MTMVQAALLGVVEGLTEFLPISSTGHLILTAKLLNISQTDFVKTFEIFIQLGAILAVVVLYAKGMIKNHRAIIPIIIAFIPNGILGIFFHSIVKQYLLGNSTVVVASLLIGGIILIGFELLFRERSEAVNTVDSISLSQASTVGVFQAIAFIPGVSRAAATIVGGMLVGISREAIVEFSFLLAVPTMLAASGLDLLKTSMHFSSQETLLLATGFLVSFLVAMFAIRWLLNFIQHHTFIGFGIYRIVAALMLYAIVLR